MFVNPRPAKGAAVFARIALELRARRPEIPLLVEGRGTADGLAGIRLALWELRNLHRIPHVPNPRAIYGPTRVSRMPSLVPDSYPAKPAWERGRRPFLLRRKRADDAPY